MDLRELFLSSTLIYNLADSEDHVLYHEASRSIMRNVDPDAIRKTMTEAERKWYFGPDGHTCVARLTYNPYLENGPWGEDEMGLPRFNIYCPPEWRAAAYFDKALVEPSKGMPKLIQRFLTHFTANDKESEEFLLDWLATSLKQRNGTYLCILSKIQGTGKGVLGEMCRTIFGEQNAKKVRGDALNSRFNAQFANTQFIMFDEFDLKDATALDRAKDLVNAKLEMEKKGKDAVEIDNQLNGMFASNRMGAIPELGRRFSIPVTSDVQLKLSFTTEEIRALQYDTKMIEEFARYLWWREVKRDMWIPLVSARTNEVRDYGLAEWESTLVEEVFCKCPKGAFLKLTDLKKILKDKTSLRALPGRQKFGDLAAKFPEYLKHHFYLNKKTNKQEWGISFLKAFPDYQLGNWCEKCQNIIPDNCTCRRDP